MTSFSKPSGPITRAKLYVKATSKVLEKHRAPISAYRLHKEVCDYIIAENMYDPEAPEGKQQLLPVENDFTAFLVWMVSKKIISMYTFENRKTSYWGKGLSVMYEFANDDPAEDRDDFPTIEDQFAAERIANAPEDKPGRPRKRRKLIADISDVVGIKPEEEKKVDVADQMIDAETRKDVFQLKGRVSVLEDQVGELKTEIFRLQKTRKVEYTIIKEGKKTVIKDTMHNIFPEVMFQIECGFFPMLIGPSGCGKTELAMMLAKILKKRFAYQSVSGGVTEVKFFGRAVQNVMTGKIEYHGTQFQQFYEEEKGGLFLLDEVDGGDPNVLLALNGPLSNGVMTLDRPRNPVINMSKNFICISAANTWGAGADRQYVGRNQLDGAFIKRFVQIGMDYDKDMELKLCPGQEAFVERMHKYREAIRRSRIERVLDTRFILRGAKWLRCKKDDVYVDSKLFEGWRADEIAKVKGVV